LLDRDLDEARSAESRGGNTLCRFISSTKPIGKDIAAICSTAATRSTVSLKTCRL
jgi:hypothetical protein